MAAERTEDLERVLGQADKTALMPTPVTGWCLVLVRPGQEQEARDSLRRQGVGAWWPNYPREVSAKDAQTGKRYMRVVLSGTVPGTIFSPAKFDDRFWRAIDHAPGVINVARRFSGDVLMLTDTDIALIHKIEAGQNQPKPPQKSGHNFQVGDAARLIDDVLGRWPPGKVVKCSKDGHILIEVNIFGRMACIDVLPHQIEKLKQKKT